MITTVGDLMDRDLTVVMEHSTISEAIDIFYSHSVAGLPVVDVDWRLVGFLSETDILRAATPSYLEVLTQSSFLSGEEEEFARELEKLGDLPVRDYMVKPPIAVEPYVSLMSIADLMIRKHFRRLPVVEDGVLIGIIDRRALWNFMLEGYARNVEQGEA
ncbi:MAG: CBS domain-containing protein [Synergistaceae bacterium]|jgi:CBS domain-containing protein|nr:CBS domain-containing protein [Synergistaceae bacterium]